MTDPALSRFAAQLFQQRQRKAQAAVAARSMSRSQAEQHLRPWLAIACRAGADLPELAQGLAELRITNADGTPWCSEAQARAMLADEICPPIRWKLLLAKARDRALDKADAEPDPAGPAHIEAQQLQALCHLLGVTTPYFPSAHPELVEGPRP